MFMVLQIYIYGITFGVNYFSDFRHIQDNLDRGSWDTGMQEAGNIGMEDGELFFRHLAKNFSGIWRIIFPMFGEIL